MHLVAPPNGKDYSWSNGAEGRVLKIKAPPDGPSTYSVRWFCIVCLKWKEASITLCGMKATRSITPESYANASDGRITLAIYGGEPPYSYQWSNGKTSPSIGGLSVGVYSVTVTGRYGCQEILQNISIGVKQLQVRPLASEVSVSCPGSNDASNSVVISGGAPPYSVWLNGLYIPNMDGTTAHFQNLDKGKYDVRVTDAAGNSASTQFSVKDPEPLRVHLAFSHVSCNGANDGSITATITGGTPPYSTFWSDGVTGPQRHKLHSGQYTLIASDKFGCTLSAQATIEQPLPIKYSVATIDALCFGAANGRAVITVQSPIQCQASWSNGATGLILDGVPAGQYTFRLYDDGHCTTGSISIGQPAQLEIQPKFTGANGYAIDCHGGASGTFKVYIKGGMAPYTVVFHPQEGARPAALRAGYDTVEVSRVDSFVTLSGLTAGAYLLDITDANQCRARLALEVTEPEALGVQIKALKKLNCFRDSSGYAEALPFGGVPPYRFVWYSGEANIGQMPRINLLPAGTYRVLVTDANGCAVMDSAYIARRAKLTVLFDRRTGKARVSGGAPPYKVVSNEDTKRGYRLTVQDSNGCTCTDTYTRPPKLPEGTRPPRRRKKPQPMGKGVKCPAFSAYWIIPDNSALDTFGTVPASPQAGSGQTKR